MQGNRYSTDDLLYLMSRLRDPESGCPWDLKQNFATIVPCTLEECYELVAAIEADDYDHVREELGDVLFQVVFYAQLAAEEQRFNFADVVHGLVAKLIRRHPHVFSLGTLDSGPPQFALSEAEINANWELSKAGERAGKNQHGTFDDVPLHLPALTRAQKIQKRAAREGFDWPDSSGVVAKLREEVEEVERAFEAEGRERQLEELGDVLFSCVNLARHLGADSEALLRHSTNKFQTRFEAMQKTLIARGISTELADPEQLDRAWEDVKAAESL